MLNINLPKLSLVLLIGSSSSGKSTFAKKYFKDSEIISSDNFRKLISDDKNNNSKLCNELAFNSLYNLLNNRLKYGKLTVIDATNVISKDREKIINIAKENNVEIVAIKFNIPIDTIKQFYESRTDNRSITFNKIIYQKNLLDKDKFVSEKFKYIYTINSIEDLNNCNIILNDLSCDKNNYTDTNKFDIIGDIHGCYDELLLLIQKLGYDKNYLHPDNRRLIFLGDLCDRGPKNVETLKLVMKLVNENKAFCVRGNHDHKLLKKLINGNYKDDKLTNGLDLTINEIEKESKEFKDEIISFISSLDSHYVFDNYRLVVSHAGIKEEYINRSSSKVFNFCLFGDTTGEKDDNGFPIRRDWASDYKGKATNVYGHTPYINPIIKNKTYCIDTGCVFGNKLTAFRYPEKELIYVDALNKYYDQDINPNLLNNKDNIVENINFTDEFSIDTNLIKNIKIKKSFAHNALYSLNRSSIENNFLIYLSPTMSPCDVSTLNDYLEYPNEALNYYKSNGINTVICEKKHMGSRCIIIVGKDKKSIKNRFNTNEDTLGRIYSRTGKPFYDYNNEQELLQYISNILSKRDFWKDFNTNWVIIDTEQLPWNEKANELIKSQYASTGISGFNGLNKSLIQLNTLYKYRRDILDEDSKDKLFKLIEKYNIRFDNINLYNKEYKKYCWDINSIEDNKIAPFHILASENNIYTNKDHLWHLNNIKKYFVDDNKIIETPYIVIDLNKDDYVERGVNFWNSILDNNGEGMVVKPLSFIAYNKDTNVLLQPAIKCRGRDYLRIIYSPDYLSYLNRLKKRNTNRKRELALKEFALGIEALERFVNYDSIQRVYECIFSLMALETDYTDPRL